MGSELAIRALAIREIELMEASIYTRIELLKLDYFAFDTFPNDMSLFVSYVCIYNAFVM